MVVIYKSIFLVLSSTQALHKISLRENVCTVRVCEVLLSLASTLIDLGVLANNTKALLLSSLVKSDNNKAEDGMATAAVVVLPTPPVNDTTKDKPENENGTSHGESEKGHSPPPSSSTSMTPEFSLHNTFMDIVIRYGYLFFCVSYFKDH